MSILDLPYESLTPAQKRQYTMAKKRVEAQSTSANASPSNGGPSSSAPPKGRQTRSVSSNSAENIQPRRISAASAAAANARKVSGAIEPLPRPRATPASTSTKRAAPAPAGASGRKRTRLDGPAAATVTANRRNAPQTHPLSAVTFATNTSPTYTPTSERPSNGATPPYSRMGSMPSRPANASTTSRPTRATPHAPAAPRPNQTPSTRATEDIDVNMSDDDLSGPPRLRRSRHIILDDEDEAPEDEFPQLENAAVSRERAVGLEDAMEESPEHDFDLDAADPHAEAAEFLDESHVYGDATLDDGAGCPAPEHLFDDAVQPTSLSIQHTRHDSELPEWQDEKRAGDGAAGQASNNAPHVYPSYTDLVPPPRGKRDYALHEQSPEVQTMMSTAMYEVVGDCTFVNAFLDAGNPVPYYQSVLIQAATKHGYGPLAQRIKSDLSYIQPLGRWLSQRICKVRSEYKSTNAGATLESLYDLPTPGPERAAYVDYIINTTSLYKFPSTSRVHADGTVTREYDRTKPYRHRAIINVIKDNNFGSDRIDGFAAKYAHRFSSSLPNLPHELELPIPMVALAAAAVATSLGDHQSTGARSSKQMMRSEMQVRYNAAVDALREIKTDSPGRFHHLMTQLYEDTSQGLSIVSSRVTAHSEMESIDLAGMPM
ncbi:hypothetical protein EV122DRAFT_284818 [Schizophyllum commune]